ncbi:transcriptional regulator family: Fungal Specific TF [Penicillium angulare]|uniref:transcriptional regulator family: Fungal Specific TF n=1 Tax=Penicillium angulare TaxID=116970 RepID=UPI0025414C96|nr:transcriptional regulator family: Fungal Specific TF [Penicillium angulare]KAJ5288686.1 transcriptional regulator family: Fungal Specific TF [Penicillium angulare]
MDTGSSALTGSKLRTACDLCRLRKIRCDRAQPACENCHIARHPCIFTPQSNQTRKGLRDELSATQARVRELEDALKRTQNSACQPSDSQPSNVTSQDLSLQPHGQPPPFNLDVSFIPDTRPLEAAISVIRSHLSHCGLGTPDSSIRADFYSAVYQKTGYVFDLEDFLLGATQSSETKNLTSNRRPVILSWPFSNLVQLCINHYIESGLYSLFPFADVVSLQFLLDSQVLDQSKHARASSRACLAAFTANITIMHRHKPEFSGANPDAYAQAAFTLIPQIITELADLRTLEAIMMLIIYLSPLGQSQPIDLLLGIAIQTLYSLGGHKKKSSQGTSDQASNDRHLRALFWLCYGIDSELSIRNGRPPLLNHDHCDLDLPVNYAQKSKEQHFYWKPLCSDELLYPSDLRFNLIKTKIYAMLYSEKNAPQSEAGRIQLIRELDNELSDLRSEFPVNCRPDVFATENTPKYVFHDLSIRGVSIHLEYYYCLGQIHGANNPYNISAAGSHLPLPSSAEITYEAARSTLIYIGRVRHYINYHTFWIHADFILTAIITLFRFLIMRPSAPGFSRDIQIMEETAQIFAEFLTSDDPERRGFSPFYLTHRFIKWLVFLALGSHSR